MLLTNKVETVKVHYLVPHPYKIMYELFLGILTCVNFRQSPELGVRTEDEVNPGGGPLKFAALTITAFKQIVII